MPETPDLSPVVLDDLAQTLQTVHIARAKAKEWTLIADAAMAEIKERVGDAPEATIGGQSVVKHSTRTVTRLDSKRLRAELPEPVLAPYLNVTTEHRYDLVERA